MFILQYVLEVVMSGIIVLKKCIQVESDPATSSTKCTSCLIQF